MKDELKKAISGFPYSLQKQIIERTILGTLGLLLFWVLILCGNGIALGLPCLVFAVLLFISAGRLFYICWSGSYLRMFGECKNIYTNMRKRITRIEIDFSGVPVSVHIKQQLRNIHVGDPVLLLVSNQTPVYEHDGLLEIYDYCALERTMR